MHFPNWLNLLAVISLSLALASALVVALDLFGHPQHMWIMDVVWPVTALYFGPLALWAYFRWGRLSSHHAVMEGKEQGTGNPAQRKPFWQKCAVGATHCGAGCALGDIVAEWLVFVFPLVLFGHKIFGSWLVDFLCAFLLGIVFQYFTIKPMRHLGVGQGLLAAIKADALSIVSWQIGMYGWMALVTFWWVGHELRKTNPVFWFMMQIAMWVGFLTAFPMNWWLLKRKIKEPM